MPTIDVHNAEGQKVSTVDLDDTVFGVEVKEHLLYDAVRYQRAKARAGTHKAKGRAEVRGGGKKPFKQKGTGRARAGTTRAPHWRGGGVVFGPHVRSHAHKLNKKIRRAALCSALSRRAEGNAILVLDGLTLPEVKTRQVTDFMKRFELGDMLLVLSGRDENILKSTRNLPNVTVLLTEGLNVYDVLHRGNLVLTQDAVQAVTERLGG